MVVADSDLETIRQRIDQNTDVKPAAILIAGELLAALELDSAVRASQLASCAERAVEALALPLDRSASDYADAALKSGGDPADVVILGLNAGQHAKAVIFASACQAYASLYRAGNSLRDTGDAQSSSTLSAPIAASVATLHPLLRESATALVDSISASR